MNIRNQPNDALRRCKAKQSKQTKTKQTKTKQGSKQSKVSKVKQIMQVKQNKARKARKQASKQVSTQASKLANRAFITDYDPHRILVVEDEWDDDEGTKSFFKSAQN